jgi:type VI secretion system protein ImpJ
VFASGKVLWKEGMFLQPQHFQQSERYLLNLLAMRLANGVAAGYGFAECEIHGDAVANGTFTVSRAGGIMPDGTPFSIPSETIAPAAKPFGPHFSHDRQSLDVYLGLPLVVDGRANIASNDATGVNARYTPQTVPVSDEGLGGQRKDIEIGNLNFTILYEDESRDNFTVLRVGRLKRNSSGQIEIDQTFVAPLLHVGASAHLLAEIRSLLEILLAKIASLSQGRRQKASGLAEFKGTEETAFRLLQTINTYTPLLNHMHIAPQVHPYELFVVLTQLTGALCTFSAEVSIKHLPRYDHENLGEMTAVFARLIRAVLGADLSAGCVTIPVEQAGPATFTCKVSDEKLFSTAQFYFGVSAAVPEKELVVGALQRIKMSSRDRLELLIPSAMPGLPLIHVARPPEGLSTKPGFVYFRLDQRGDFWDGIKTSGTIAFYFPNSYPSISMELLALRE